MNIVLTIIKNIICLIGFAVLVVIAIYATIVAELYIIWFIPDPYWQLMIVGGLTIALLMVLLIFIKEERNARNN